MLAGLQDEVSNLGISACKLAGLSARLLFFACQLISLSSQSDPLSPKLKRPISSCNALLYQEGEMAEKDMIVMSQKGSNRLYIIRRTIERAITQDRAAELLGITNRRAGDGGCQGAG
jgi:hypothetical protein